MKRSAINQAGEFLVIDGTADDGTYQGDANKPPFVVFNVDKQTNVAGPFYSMRRAKAALAKLVQTRSN